jgi:hypothetical protein
MGGRNAPEWVAGITGIGRRSRGYDKKNLIKEEREYA